MEIANYVSRGGHKVTPGEAEAFRQQLPALKVKVEEIDAPEYPKLRRRLRLLMELFEDVLDGEYVKLPYVAFAEVVFALAYVFRDNDIIPDSVPGMGLADDASIVGAVIVRHEAALSAYAATKGVSWSEVSADSVRG